MNTDEYLKTGLGFSDLKTLLRSPRLYRYQAEHGRADTPAFDFGQAAHALVLGIGEDIQVGDFENWRTKASQEWRDEVRNNGGVPMLRDDYERVANLADIVLSHPIAGPLFTDGDAEVAATRDVGGVTLRARADWKRNDGILLDLKTTTDADPASFGRSAFKWGYHIQHANYVDTFGARTLLFVEVEKDAPHLISVNELDADAVEHGRRSIERALDIYRTCVADNAWPDFPNITGINETSLPTWVYRQDAA